MAEINAQPEVERIRTNAEITRNKHLMIGGGGLLLVYMLFIAGFVFTGHEAFALQILQITGYILGGGAVFTGVGNALKRSKPDSATTFTPPKE